MRYSIVIGTYNHLEDCLRPCVDSILKYTTLNDFSTELIIVANGCTDGTREYVESLQGKFHNIKLIWFDEPLGFPRAYNEGIKASQGDYVVLFNNDNILLDQPYNKWLQELSAPFEVAGHAVGMTGPMKEHCPYADRDFILFFCVMLSRSAINLVGLLDESFSPGYGEDTDYCARLQDLGFRLVQVPDESRLFYDTNRRTGVFPLYHAGNKTFANWPDGDKVLEKNRNILKEKYGKKEPVVAKGLIFDIRKAQTCDGYMSDDELLWLASQAKNSKIVIEVGSWHGRSSRALADNLPDEGRLYCVDHWDGSAVERDTHHASARLNEGDHAFMEFSDNLADHIQSGKVIPIRMSSKNAATWFKKQGIKADLIFLDAGHTYEEVKDDINLWWPLTGKILSGHDYNYTDGMWGGVTQAVDELLIVEQAPATNIWVAKEVNSSEIVRIKSAKPQIYDCFPFFNELDILDIRLAELYDKVDRFVITEATLTHGGIPKPLYFADNLDRYAKYLHKITHIVVDQYPALDSWSIERHQRDQLIRGLSACNDNDIIIISDADEIPRATAIDKYVDGVMGFEQNLYYYKINCESTQKWDWAKVATYKEVMSRTPCGVRYTPTTTPETLIPNGGWHFSYIADIQGIITKIEASAHQEYNKEEWKVADEVEKRVNEARDIFNRPLHYVFVPIDDTYPKYILDNLEQFKSKGLIAEYHQVA